MSTGMMNGGSLVRSARDSSHSSDLALSLMYVHVSHTSGPHPSSPTTSELGLVGAQAWVCVGEGGESGAAVIV